MVHLEELRRRLVISAIGVAIATVVCFIFAQRIFQLLLRPAEGIEPIFTQMTEMIGTYMTVSVAGGIVLSMPLLVYQGVMFASPALSRREKKYLYALLPAVFIAFCCGAAFCYFVLLPPALTFLLTFGTEVAVPMIKIGNYISIVTKLLFSLGMVFEIPILVFFLAKIGIVKPDMLSKNRRWAIIAAFILGAMITPTFDPVNQSLVAAPIIILFEISILLAKIARPPVKKTKF